MKTLRNGKMLDVNSCFRNGSKLERKLRNTSSFFFIIFPENLQIDIFMNTFNTMIWNE